jgi:hypothetical protein
VTSTTGILSGPSPARRVTVAGLAVLAAVAVAGAVTGVRGLVDGGSGPAAAVAPPASAHAASHKVGDEIPTGFGWIATASVDKSSGVASSAVGGNTHFPSFIGADKVQVQVALDIRNTLEARHEVRADQFSLRSGGKSYLPGGATAAAMQIQPDASAGQILSFTLPRNNKPITLVFSEAPGAPPIRVDLGRAQSSVERGVPGAGKKPSGDGHAHPSAPSTPGTP